MFLNYDEALQKLAEENCHIRWDRLDNVGEFFTNDKAAGNPRAVEGRIDSVTFEELKQSERIIKVRNHSAAEPRYDWYDLSRGTP